MPKCECLRCGYKWQSEIGQPRKCAKCRSYLWNKPRKYRLKVSPEAMPTASRRPRFAAPKKLYGMTLEELLTALDEFEKAFPGYQREVDILRRITKTAFSRIE